MQVQNSVGEAVGFGFLLKYFYSPWFLDAVFKLLKADNLVFV